MINMYKQLVDNLLKCPSEDNMSLLINYVNLKELSPSDTAYLSQILASSGEKLSHRSDNGIDVASTGGPSSLSTLLVPLFLRTLNKTIPKLAVPGRPAGGIDVLATLPGYKIKLLPGEIIRCLDECGYAHFIAGEIFTPLDASFFSYRQNVGTQQKVPLVVASILAKKIAVSIPQVGLDIRVGIHCNFGYSFHEARLNAKYFNSVANILGIKSACILTDASKPYQPWIGRGEALVALNEIFNNKTSGTLQNHVHRCWDMAVAVVGSSVNNVVPDGSTLKKVFSENLVSQGSNLKEFDIRVQAVLQAHKTFLYASQTGYVVINLGGLRSIIVNAQQSESDNNNEFSDPLGVRLLVNPGDFVSKGTPLASLRIEPYLKENSVNQLEKAIYTSTKSSDQELRKQLDEVVIDGG